MSSIEEYLRRQRERAHLEKTEHTHQMYGCMTDVLTHDHGIAQMPNHTHPGHICGTVYIDEFTHPDATNWVDYGPALY